ncbi:MAG: YheU family protein [Cellvibrionaceae bacterium]|nr:YheU family protein [Cellvibrionaceae bacterium]
MIIPHRQLEPATLRALLETIVNREGTDYGVQEASLEAKISQLQGQLERGEASISYDEASESVNLLSKAQLRELQQQQQAQPDAGWDDFDFSQ